MWRWNVSDFTFYSAFFITSLLKHSHSLQLAAGIPAFSLNTAGSDLHLLVVTGGGGQNSGIYKATVFKTDNHVFVKFYSRLSFGFTGAQGRESFSAYEGWQKALV